MSAKKSIEKKRSARRKEEVGVGAETIEGDEVEVGAGRSGGEVGVEAKTKEETGAGVGIGMGAEMTERRWWKLPSLCSS